jgi:EmrB/QacA subfamily drug resistance transporter
LNERIVEDPSLQRGIVFSIALAAFMCTLDSYIVNISLPTIAHSFNVSTGIVSRIVLVYLLVLTSTILLFGKLGDRFGLIRMFQWGYGIFTVGSLLCSLSGSMSMLIGARCIQGIGGALMFTVPPATVPLYLPKDRRGWAFGLITTSASIGLCLGAPLGGLLTSALSWHWIFLINVPVGIFALILVRRVFPEGKSEPAVRKNEGFDTPGIMIYVTMLLSLIYALNSGQEMGWGSPVIIGCLILFFICLPAFILRERAAKSPLLDITLFHSRDYSFANLANFFTFSVMAGSSFILPFYLTVGRNLKVDAAGLVMIIPSLVLMMVGPVAGRLSDRLSPRILCILGSCGAALAFLFFALTLQGPGFFQVVVYLCVLGVSLGSFIPSNNNQIVSLVPMEKQGAASGVLKTVTNTGAVIGVSLFETVFAQALPGHIKGSGAHILHTALTRDELMRGFQSVYLWAGCIAALALLSSFLARDRTKEEMSRIARPSADSDERIVELV